MIVLEVGQIYTLEYDRNAVVKVVRKVNDQLFELSITTKWFISEQEGYRLQTRYKLYNKFGWSLEKILKGEPYKLRRIEYET